jgi:hypothetical protein
MRAKTSELTGPALDWAVAKAENRLSHGIGLIYLIRNGVWLDHCNHQYSTNWSQGGPIITQHLAGFFKYNKLDPSEPDKFGAHVIVQRSDWRGDRINIALCLDGPTPLIAAMRCYVASKLGDEVEVPKELL